MTRTSAGRRVALVVEQSATSRALLKAKLGKGFQVVAATSLDEAARVLEDEPPHLVLCQRFLGGDSGLDLCRAMRTRPAFVATPFVLLATDATDELRAEAKAAGAQAVIAKSVGAEALLQLCETLLAATSRADEA